MKRITNNIHNMSNSREYTCWKNMRRRCGNPRAKDFANYGGRGIFVCEDWNKSFVKFYSDMGSPPSKKHTLDRINNDLGYCKENCKWSDIFEQSINKRSRVNKSNMPKGVCRNKNKNMNMYSSSIWIQKCKYHLGSFDTPEKAHEAYRVMFKYWYGKESL